jgi:hypothetical protein
MGRGEEEEKNGQRCGLRLPGAQCLDFYRQLLLLLVDQLACAEGLYGDGQIENEDIRLIRHRGTVIFVLIIGAKSCSASDWQER